MRAGSKGKLTYANVMATVAVFIALGGGAYAVSLGKNDVGPREIAKNAVRSSELKNNGVKGKDVDESSLGRVPGADFADRAGSAGSANTASTAASAEIAGSAETANSANSAANASQVNGLSVVKINGRLQNNELNRTVLDLAGLKLVASCPAVGSFDVVASTSKENSSLYGYADYPPNLDSDSFDREGGEFDTGTPVSLNTEFGNLGDPRVGGLVYEAPDGASVTVQFAADFNGTSRCVFTGTAIGG